MVFNQFVLPLVVALAIGSTFAIECRQENLFVGGEVVGTDYIYDVTSEEACKELCIEKDECQAVNYFPDHQACLLQKDTLITNPELNKDENIMTVYIIVKNCDGGGVADAGIPDAKQQQVRKRQTIECRQEGKFVFGSSITVTKANDEEDCKKKCEDDEECQAITYLTVSQRCILQRNTLLTDPNLRVQEIETAIYYIVKNCDGGGVADPGIPNSAQIQILGRRKRQTVECYQEGKFVFGSPITVIKANDEEDCEEKCKDDEECQAINYLTVSQKCILQRDSLRSNPSLEVKELPTAIYSIVKNCDGGGVADAGIPDARQSQV